MTKLAVLAFPDERLRLKAGVVVVFDHIIDKIVGDMFETMYDDQGIGLAATQVGIRQRIVTIDISSDKQNPLCLINPVIVVSEGAMDSEEGCLSVPEIYAQIHRAEQVTVNFNDQQGQAKQLQASGLLAACIQHEIDHLDGKLFIDHLSPLKRSLLIRKLRKRSRTFQSSKA